MGKKSNNKRFLLNSIAIFICLIILLPFINLLVEAINGLRAEGISLGTDSLKQIKGTLSLVIFSTGEENTSNLPNSYL